MANVMLLLAAGLSLSAPAAQTVSAQQSKNGEFIFSKYPPRALSAGEQGVVRFRAKVDPRGNVLQCDVTGGSGHPLLDAETCELIVAHARFSPALDSQGVARASLHDGTVKWQIPGRPLAQSSQLASAGPVPEAVVCKRIPQTGSLVKHSRLCLTRKEWTRYADQTQDDWGDLQGRKGNTRELEPEIEPLNPGN